MWEKLRASSRTRAPGRGALSLSEHLPCCQSAHGLLSVPVVVITREVRPVLGVLGKMEENAASA